MKNIYFFNEDIVFSLKNKTKIRNWIKETILQNNKGLQFINFIFTSDTFLLNVNKEYLNHDTLTDIITFDQSINPEIIEADIYLSIERIKENSRTYGIPFEEELHRVMIHGVLHLLGYNDKEATEKEEMRKKENHYLALRF